MGEPKRVLHILQRMEAGGTQALLMNIYRKIDRSKLQFDFLVVYSEKQFYDDEVLNLGGKIYRSTFREDLNLLKFCKYLNSFFREHNTEYDIVHVHAYTIGYFCLKYAEKWGIPVRIAHSHSNAVSKDFTRFFKYPMKKLFLIHANEYFACSKEAGDFLFGNKGFKILNNSIDSKKFIYNDDNREQFRKQLGIDDCFVIGHVGRFHIEKNHKFLLEIFNEILKINSKAKLLLTGSGPLEKEIREIVRQKNLEDAVIFLGNRNDMENVFHALDIFVLPSSFEGLGIAAIEAQAAGIPSICSDGLPEIANISPLFYKVSLRKNAAEWAQVCIQAAGNKYAHMDMHEYVINAGFDIDVTSKEVQQFYLEKIQCIDLDRCSNS